MIHQQAEDRLFKEVRIVSDQTNTQKLSLLTHTHSHFTSFNSLYSQISTQIENTAYFQIVRSTVWSYALDIGNTELQQASLVFLPQVMYHMRLFIYERE